jgi:uncharacterized protein YcgI (DUF1989 family)
MWRDCAVMQTPVFSAKRCLRSWKILAVGTTRSTDAVASPTTSCATASAAHIAALAISSKRWRSSGCDRSYIVSNVNFFMSVPVAIDGAVVNIYGHSAAGNYVDLRAERDVLAVLSNCPQMHNSCNAYNLTPIRAIIWRPSRSGKP